MESIIGSVFGSVLNGHVDHRGSFQNDVNDLRKTVADLKRRRNVQVQRWLEDARRLIEIEMPDIEEEVQNVSNLSRGNLGRPVGQEIQEDREIYDRGSFPAGLVIERPPRNMITFERTLVVINFVLELPSAVLDNIPSVPKPLYALILMLLSFAALLLCVTELVYRVREKRVSTRRRENNEKPFFSNIYNIVGFISAVCQSILTTVNYVLLVQHTKIQIHISVLPIIFAFFLLYSKFRGTERQV